AVQAPLCPRDRRSFLSLVCAKPLQAGLRRALPVSSGRSEVRRVGHESAIWRHTGLTTSNPPQTASVGFRPVPAVFLAPPALHEPLEPLLHRPRLLRVQRLHL